MDKWLYFLSPLPWVGWKMAVSSRGALLSFQTVVLFISTVPVELSKCHLTIQRVPGAVKEWRPPSEQNFCDIYSSPQGKVSYRMDPYLQFNLWLNLLSTVKKEKNKENLSWMWMKSIQLLVYQKYKMPIKTHYRSNPQYLNHTLAWMIWTKCSWVQMKCTITLSMTLI